MGYGDRDTIIFSSQEPLCGTPGAYHLSGERRILSEGRGTTSKFQTQCRINGAEKRKIAETGRAQGEGHELECGQEAEKSIRSGRCGPRPSPQFCGLVGLSLCPC